MPKRIIDFDAVWASTKISDLSAIAQPEYTWLYGLADASGSFELTNIKVIWGRSYAIRKNFPLSKLKHVFEEFERVGLMFTWHQGTKRYAHWTASELPGRLPPPSHQSANYERKSGAELPVDKYTTYKNLHQAQPYVPPGDDCVCFGKGKGIGIGLGKDKAPAAPVDAEPLDLGLQVVLAVKEAVVRTTTHPLFEIWQEERGVLPDALVLSPGRLSRCRARIKNHSSDAEGFLANFRKAVRLANQSSFLTGRDGGWKAGFDWFIANDENYQKALAQSYGNGREKPVPSAVTIGQAPFTGMRVKPEALERIRKREGESV